MKKWIVTVMLLALVAMPAQALAMPPQIVADRALWAEPDGPVAWAKDTIDDAIRYEFFVGYPRGTEEFDLGLILNDKPNGMKITGTYTPDFRPLATITRAEFATILARATGFEDEFHPGTSLPFRDTPADAWYVRYLAPLVEQRVIRLADRPGDNFGPDDPITRVEIAVWAARAADAYGVRVGPAPLSFKDANQVASIYRQDVGKAVALGVVRGYEDGTLRPYATATRAEAAAMLMRLLGHFKNNLPTAEELLRAVQASFDARSIWARDNPGGAFAATNWQQILSPWYMPGTLTWWAMPEGESCSFKWEVAEPRPICTEIDGVVPASTARIRRDPMNHYGVTEFLEGTILSLNDRMAEVEFNLRSVAIPGDDNRGLPQTEGTVVIYLRKDAGRWKYAGERSATRIRGGYFDKTLAYRLDGKALADLP